MNVGDLVKVVKANEDFPVVGARYWVKDWYAEEGGIFVMEDASDGDLTEVNEKVAEELFEVVEGGR